MMISRTEALYEVIRLVRPLYKTLEATVALELEETGVSVSQRAILEQLLDKGQQTVPMIGRSLILPRQFIQKTVNELLDAHLIAKQDNAAHKRSVLLNLTPDGLAMITRIKECEAAIIHPIAEALNEEDVATTKTTMDDMIGAFHAHNTYMQRKRQEEGV